MDNKRRCIHCKCNFYSFPHIPKQMYCSKKECQKERRKKWAQYKLHNDQDYRDNKKISQKNWKSKNYCYWKSYKRDHPEYVKQDKDLSKKRAQKSRMCNMKDFGNPVLRILAKKKAIIDFVNGKKISCKLVFCSYKNSS